jgi:DNA mismatch repair ATPase MutS
MEKGFKAPFDSMKVLEKRLQDTEHEKSVVEMRFYALQHQFKELMSSYEILNNRCLSESEMNAEETAMIVQRANDEIARIQKERDDEKQQYFALQKGFGNQIESGKIGFNNLVKRVIEMRNAQNFYFEKKRKTGNALQELQTSKKMESDLDNYLRQFQTNLFIK